MIKVFILVVLTQSASGGGVAAFQEFNSLKSCKKNAAYLNSKFYVRKAYCTEK